jgi:hypothetical protein
MLAHHAFSIDGRGLQWEMPIPYPGAQGFLPPTPQSSLRQLRAAAAKCRGCDLHGWKQVTVPSFLVFFQFFSGFSPEVRGADCHTCSRLHGISGCRDGSKGIGVLSRC